jgi:hypothetical protein
MNRDECRAEILRLYKDYTPPYTWRELDEIFTRNEKKCEAMKYPAPIYWLLREGAR